MGEYMGLQSANRREIPKTTTTTSITTKMYSSLNFLTSSLLMVTGAPGGHYRSAPPAPTKTIAELAIATPALSTLLAAVKAAGLVETLSGEGPFTVFAPTNDAFAKIPADALNGRDVPEGTTAVATAGGEEIDVTRVPHTSISIKSSAGEAGVIGFDIIATNGVVHLVDSVF